MKELVKSALRSIIARESIFRRATSDAVCVFLYHDVSEKPSRFSERYGLNVRPALFEKQIGWIRKHFNLITPDQLLSGDYAAPAAMISFDDGLPGYFEGALPILERTETPSIIFLNMEAVNGAPFWAGLATFLCDEHPAFRDFVTQRLNGSLGPEFLQVKPAWIKEFLKKNDRAGILEKTRKFHGGFSTPEHLKKAAGRPGVFFGNHLFNHYNAAALSDQEFREAYRLNAEALKGYPNFRGVFSYPFGHPGLCYNEDTNRTAFELGAKIVFSAYPLPNYGRGLRFMHRISLDEDVRTERDLFFRVLFPLLKRKLGSRAERHD